MLFFPYRADLTLHRWPLLTILLSVTCLAVFYSQTVNHRQIEQATRAFCSEKQTRAFRLALIAIYGEVTMLSCARVMLGLHTAKASSQFLDDALAGSKVLAGLTREQSDAYLHSVVTEHYTLFAGRVPPNLTHQLWYEPRTWNVLTMLSASIAHGSWLHVIGNLVFFFAFAATLEMLLGGAAYIAVLLALALLSHAVYSVATLTVPQPLPTVGLSGVVYGVMALFVFFLPRTRIRCFLWFVIIFKRVAVPAWTLVLAFVGFDVVQLFTGEANSEVNFAAHVGGAGFGYLLGVTLFRRRRRTVRRMADGVSTASLHERPRKKHWWERRARRKW